MAFVSLRAWALWGLIGTIPAAQALVLVSEEEAAQSRAAPLPLVARSPAAAGAPVIKLVAPDTAATIQSPTRIALRFEPSPQASIRPETFKVFYGALKLDITSRITGKSQVSSQGLDVSEAHLPKGSHRLVLEIQDSAGRVGSRLFSFVVD
ncbi:MAG: hypothetical protein RIS88_2239 [Pseudomonadota bacterium]|jgi:hypothetical protein